MQFVQTSSIRRSFDLRLVVLGDEDGGGRGIGGIRGEICVWVHGSFHGGDLGEYGHFPLSDSWAGIANRGWKPD
jgi:hypothetical protein